MLRLESRPRWPPDFGARPIKARKTVAGNGKRHFTLTATVLLEPMGDRFLRIEWRLPWLTASHFFQKDSFAIRATTQGAFDRTIFSLGRLRKTQRI